MFFHVKSCTKCVGEASLRPFLKIKIEYICRTDQSFMQFDFFVCLSQGLPKYIENKVLTTCFYSIYKAFFKNKERSGASLPVTFSA